MRIRLVGQRHHTTLYMMLAHLLFHLAVGHAIKHNVQIVIFRIGIKLLLAQMRREPAVVDGVLPIRNLDHDLALGVGPLRHNAGSVQGMNIHAVPT